MPALKNFTAPMCSIVTAFLNCCFLKLLSIEFVISFLFNCCWWVFLFLCRWPLSSFFSLTYLFSNILLVCTHRSDDLNTLQLFWVCFEFSINTGDVQSIEGWCNWHLVFCIRSVYCLSVSQLNWFDCFGWFDLIFFLYSLRTNSLWILISVCLNLCH